MLLRTHTASHYHRHGLPYHSTNLALHVGRQSVEQSLKAEATPFIFGEFKNTAHGLATKSFGQCLVLDDGPAASSLCSELEDSFEPAPSSRIGGDPFLSELFQMPYPK